MLVVTGVAVLLIAQLAGCEQDAMDLLLRQVMAMQTYSEEQARTGGASGIKQIRALFGGTRNYFYDDHTGKQMASIHNHANNNRVIGMGEVVVVLNGVEFRTRHNDYRLVMPHKTRNGFKDTEDIPFPNVPPSVLQKTTVQGQIDEMREYFRAFKEQRTGLRDYKPYFKPVLCYMEGAWMSSTNSIEEPFESDRHHLDASSWLELLEKIQFFSYTGGKNSEENLAFLPTRINEVINGTAVMAQWNYRIRCAPVHLDSDQGLNINRFRIVDDLTARLSYSKTLEQHIESRSARFSLGYWRNGKTGRQLEKSTRETILDTLMSQIPGYDNYNSFIPDDDFGAASTAINGSVLNSAYYHRLYKTTNRDAMGQSFRRRSFSDPNIFMAQNTQANIPGARYKGCSKKKGSSVQTCRDVRQKWSWAIPLEIIYLTPLLSWNPHNLEYRTGRDAQLVSQGGRNGGLTPDKAYNGNNNKAYFRTPKEFFQDDTDTNAADTGADVAGVLDRNGNVKQVRSSGTRIFLPSIPGVGPIRLRYPIAPLANDGSQMLKELEALKDVVLRMSSYSDILLEMPPGGNGTVSGPPSVTDLELQIDVTHSNPPGQHSHSFTLTAEDVTAIMNGQRITVETSQDLNHSHRILIGLNSMRNRLKIMQCDGERRCWDDHPPIISAATPLIRQYKANN